MGEPEGASAKQIPHVTYEAYTLQSKEWMVDVFGTTPCRLVLLVLSQPGLGFLSSNRLRNQLVVVW